MINWYKKILCSVQLVGLLLGTVLRAELPVACNDALVKSTHILLSQMGNSLQQALDTLEQERMYWLWCQAHPWRHFLSKSPVSWFRGPKQEHHVLATIQAIDQLTAELYTLYGTVIHHNMRFASSIKNSKWAQQALEIMSTLVAYRAQALDTPSMQLKALADLSTHYVHTLHHRVNLLKRPHHIERYWIPYTALTMGTLGAWRYYNANKDAVDTFVAEDVCKTYPELIKKNFDQEVSQKVTYLWNLFINKPAKPNLTQTRQQITEIKDIVVDMLKSIERCGEQNLAENAMFEASLVRLREIDIPPIKIETKILNAELTNFEQQLKELLMLATDVMANGNSSVKNVNIALGDLVEQSKQLIPIVEQMALLAVDKANFIENMIDRNEVTSAMTAILPATCILGLATWGSYKSIKGVKSWFTKQDYRAIRSYVSKAHDVLINAGSNLTNEQYGKLMYCAEKLRLQVYKNVPYYHQDAFIAHLKQLTSDALDVQQKKETIANMRATYEFLSPTFVA